MALLWMAVGTTANPAAGGAGKRSQVRSHKQKVCHNLLHKQVDRNIRIWKWRRLRRTKRTPHKLFALGSFSECVTWA